MKPDSKCERCDFHVGCARVCDSMYEMHGNGHKRAVLCILNTPEAITQKYLRMIYMATAEERGGTGSIADRADVWVTYAIKCKPPAKATLTQGKQNACRPYLVTEIRELQEKYEEVILLCCGGAASKTVCDYSQKEAVRRQGSPISHLKPMPRHSDWQENGLLKSVRVFHTFSPKMLTPGLDPSAIDYVTRHLSYLQSYLDGNLDLEPSEVTPPPMNDAEVVRGSKIQAWDIETYGFLKSEPEQRHFHPRKSKAWDAPENAIASCAITGQTGTVGFDLSTIEGYRGLLKCAKELSRSGGVLVGHNVMFDLMMLRHWLPHLRPYLDYPLQVQDTMILNYLYQEDRPEKSLKNLSPLYGLSRYDLDDSRQYEPGDPRLMAYNAQDTEVTYGLRNALEREILEKYPGTSKLSEQSNQWFTDLVWGLIWLSESGSSIDVPRLQSVDADLIRKQDSLVREAKDQFGRIIRGPGSQASIDELFVEAIREGKLETHRDLQLSEKTRKVSTGKQNINLILDAADNLSPHIRSQVEMLSEFRKAQKIQRTYSEPILRGKGKKEACRHIDGIVYPQWYPVRAEVDDGSVGGTVQARPTCKNPALPTSPPVIQGCYGTRFTPGYRSHHDYGQLEWRIAALYCGDTTMIREITEGIDSHRQTAIDVWGPEVVNEPDFKSRWRQAAKMSNFGILFRGGAKTLSTQLRRQFGIEVGIDECQTIIDAIYKRYPDLRLWQEELLDRAIAEKYLEVPGLGYSRRFKGSEVAVMKSYTSIISNMLIQASASCVNMSARFEIQKEFRATGNRHLVVLDVYDAIDVEGHLDEWPQAKRTIEHNMLNSPYLRYLEAEMGRSVPMAVDSELSCVRTTLKSALDMEIDKRYDTDKLSPAMVAVA